MRAEAAKLLLRGQKDAALRRAPDAVMIDTTATSPSEQVRMIVVD